MFDLLMEAQTLSPDQADVVTCQPAAWRDWIAAWVLDSLAAGPDAWGPFQMLAALIGAHVRLKADVNGRLVGLIFAERRPRVGEGWIQYLVVHPRFRRRGIAGALLAAAERKLALPVTKLTVRPSNTQAIGRYAGSGYTQSERIARYYSDEDGLVMVKSQA